MLDRDPKVGYLRGGVASRNVLLLGISYPCVPSQMAQHGFPQGILEYPQPSVEQAVECVRRGILTEMDARDLARCVATEQATGTNAYSVSREIGAVYRSDRHVHCDFNARNFCQTLQNQFGKDIQFSQVILDYYWMPTGWLVTRWAKTLFQQTLPDLVRHQMLTFPSLRKKQPQKHRKTGPPYDIDEGVVFLPFCAHVCKELVGAIHILEQYYEITFLTKQDLHGHALWKGTMEIDANIMQHRLGKRLDQEEIYCTFRPKDIFESMEDPHVSKPAVMRILLAIPNYNDIRMVRLRPLRQHERASVFRNRLWAPETGGFKGLDFELSKILQKELKKKGRKKYEPLPIEEEKKEDDVRVKVVKKKKKMTKTKPVSKEPVVKVEKGKEQQQHQEEEEEPEEVLTTMFQYYPGPVRDLDTYLDGYELAAQDSALVAKEREQRVAAKERKRKTGSKEKKIQQDKVRGPSIARTGKGIVFLSGDDDVPGTRTKKKPFHHTLQDSDFLSFNPRHPPAVKPWEQRKDPKTRAVVDQASEFVELDWSVIPGQDEETPPKPFDLIEDPELSASKSIVPPPANAVMLQAASVLYHCISKGLGTPNKQKDGVERVARFHSWGRPDTVAFAVDTEQSDYQNFTGYELELAESLFAKWKGEEVALQSIVESCREGAWEKLLKKEDQEWFIDHLPQHSAITRLYFNGDSTEYQVDRSRNQREISRWLLGGRCAEDDPSGCFQMVESRLTRKAKQCTGNNLPRLAYEIEVRFHQELQAHMKSSEGNKDMREAIRTFFDLQETDVADVADALMDFHSASQAEMEELKQLICKWLDHKDHLNDLTGEFQRVYAMIGEGSDQSLEELPHEMALRIAVRRKLASLLEENQRDEAAQGLSQICRGHDGAAVDAAASILSLRSGRHLGSCEEKPTHDAMGKALSGIEPQSFLNSKITTSFIDSGKTHNRRRSSNHLYEATAAVNAASELSTFLPSSSSSPLPSDREPEDKEGTVQDAIYATGTPSDSNIQQAEKEQCADPGDFHSFGAHRPGLHRAPLDYLTKLTPNDNTHSAGKGKCGNGSHGSRATGTISRADLIKAPTAFSRSTFTDPPLVAHSSQGTSKNKPESDLSRNTKGRHAINQGLEKSQEVSKNATQFNVASATESLSTVPYASSVKNGVDGTKAAGSLTRFEFETQNISHTGGAHICHRQGKTSRRGEDLTSVGNGFEASKKSSHAMRSSAMDSLATQPPVPRKAKDTVDNARRRKRNDELPSALLTKRSRVDAQTYSILSKGRSYGTADTDPCLPKSNARQRGRGGNEVVDSLIRSNAAPRVPRKDEWSGAMARISPQPKCNGTDTGRRIRGAPNAHSGQRSRIATGGRRQNVIGQAAGDRVSNFHQSPEFQTPHSLQGSADGGLQHSLMHDSLGRISTDTIFGHEYFGGLNEDQQMAIINPLLATCGLSLADYKNAVRKVANYPCVGKEIAIALHHAIFNKALGVDCDSLHKELQRRPAHTFLEMVEQNRQLQNLLRVASQHWPSAQAMAGTFQPPRGLPIHNIGAGAPCTLPFSSPQAPVARVGMVTPKEPTTPSPGMLYAINGLADLSSPRLVAVDPEVPHPFGPAPYWNS